MFVRVFTTSLVMIVLIGLASFSGIVWGQSRALAQFIYVSDDSVADVMLYDIRTQLEFNLTRSPNIVELRPRWSPDASKIVYEIRLRNSGTPRLMQMDADGRNPRTFGGLLENNDRQAVWSPDGRQIAYTALNEANFDIRWLDLESGRNYRVTRDVGRDVFPAWSPDGTQIAFTSDRDAQDAEVYIYTLATDSFVPITDNPVFDYQPLWLDADRLVFLSSRDSFFGLYTINADGTDETVLTDAFFWSSMASVVDSNRIIFSAQRNFGDYVHIYLMNIDTGAVQQLTDGNRNYFYGAWRPSP